MSERCTRPFFARDAARVARALIGCTLVRRIGGDRVSGRIVETEAYLGAHDLASHAAGGRRTARNEPMWGPPGTCYVYFTYGMHHCVNVSCFRQDHPAAVLVRALEPLEGVELMRAARLPGTVHRDLCRGPARLCKALAIGPALNAVDVFTSDAVWFEPRPAGMRFSIVVAPRVGIAGQHAWVSKPLRFLLSGSEFVSGTQRVHRAGRRGGEGGGGVGGTPGREPPRR